MKLKLGFEPFFILSIIIGLALLFSTTVLAGQADMGSHVPGQVLVKFKAGTPRHVVEATLRGQKSMVKDEITGLNVLVLQVPPQAAEKVVVALSNNPNVEYAELDYIAQALVDDTFFSNQWGLENTVYPLADIDAPSAWGIEQGENAVVVAILDSGISKSHPDLSVQVIDRSNFSGAASDDDVYGHGTHVGGIVAALTNNGMGVAGVCPDCRLMSVKVLTDSGSGAYSAVAKGIEYAANNGAKVINMSLGGSQKSTTLENAVNSAWNKGVVVLAAAGNSGNTSKTYPAAYTNAIAVAATDNQDKKASFSEYGDWVDVAAPGVSIYSAWNDSSSTYAPQPECHINTDNKEECYKSASGTSMSTPMAAGVAALIWSTGDYSTATAVRNRLEATADKIAGTGTYWSAGRVNAFKAVDPTVVVPNPTPSPTPKTRVRR